MLHHIHITRHGNIIHNADSGKVSKTSGIMLQQNKSIAGIGKKAKTVLENLWVCIRTFRLQITI